MHEQKRPDQTPTPGPVLFDYACWRDPEACVLGIVSGLGGIGGGLGLVGSLWAWNYSEMPASWVVRVLVVCCAVAAAAYGLLCLYRLLGRIAIDEEGVTYTNIGRRVRIEFSEITDAQYGFPYKLVLKAHARRLALPLTRRFGPCQAYLEGDIPQLAMVQPWRADPGQLAQCGKLYVSAYSRTLFLIPGTAAAALLAAGYARFTGIRPAGASDDAVYEIAALGVMLGVTLGTLVYAVYLVSKKTCIDESGITQSCLGRETRIDFEAVENVETGGKGDRRWVRLRSGGKSIRVSRRMPGGPFLEYLLSERFPVLTTEGTTQTEKEQ